MKIARTSALPATLLAALLCVACAPRAQAQRPYQKWWKDKIKETPDPALVLDDAPLRDLAEERWLYPGWPLYPDTVFPGDGKPALGVEEQASLRRYAQAALARESGNPYKSLENLREALKKAPDSRYLRLKAAEIAISLNDLGVAEGYLDDLLEKDPVDAQALLRKGDIFVRRQKYGEAEEFYLKAVESSPGSVEGLMMLTRLAYDIQRDITKAREYALEILHVNDRNLQALYWYAETSALLGEMDTAADYYRQLFGYRRDLVGRMIEVAQRLLSTRRNADAAVLYEVAVMTQPQSEEYRLQWERLLEMQGPKEIRDGYERVIKESGGDPNVADLFADYLTRKNDIARLKELRGTVLAGHPQHHNSLLDLAAIAVLEGDYEASKGYQQRILDTNPADDALYMEIGQSWMAHGDVDDARGLFETALLLNPGNLEALELLARIEEFNGNPKNAEIMLRRALDKAPDSVELQQRLGAFYFRTKEYAAAGEQFRRAISLSPAQPELYVMLARTLLETADSDALDRMETDAAAALGKTSPFFYSLAMLSSDYGDPARARRLLEKLMGEDPRDLDVRGQLAMVYAWLERPDNALEVLNDADRYIAGDERLKLEKKSRLAGVHEVLKNYDEAARLWAEIAEAMPSELAWRERQIVALIRADKPDAADEALADVVAQHGRDNARGVQLLRAQVLQQRGDPARAAAAIRDLIKEHGPEPELQFRLANALGEANDIEGAETAYRTILDRGETRTNDLYTVSSNNLAYLFAERGIRLDEAEELVEKALRKEPLSPIYLDTLGWIEYQRGNYEAALEPLLRAARSMYRDPEIYSHLGQVHEKLGNRTEAFGWYEKALKADPTLEVIRQRRDALAGLERSGTAAGQ